MIKYTEVEALRQATVFHTVQGDSRLIRHWRKASRLSMHLQCNSSIATGDVYLLCPLAKNKQHGINDVGFAASIWPHYRGKALPHQTVQLRGICQGGQKYSRCRCWERVSVHTSTKSNGQCSCNACYGQKSLPPTSVSRRQQGQPFLQGCSRHGPVEPRIPVLARNTGPCIEQVLLAKSYLVKRSHVLLPCI